MVIGMVLDILMKRTFNSYVILLPVCFPCRHHVGTRHIGGRKEESFRLCNLNFQLPFIALKDDTTTRGLISKLDTNWVGAFYKLN